MDPVYDVCTVYGDTSGGTLSLPPPNYYHPPELLPSHPRTITIPPPNYYLGVLLRIFLTFNLQPGRLEKLIGKLAG